MVEYVFTPKQCIQLLEAIEKVRSRKAKKRPIEVNVGRWEENRYLAYVDATARRHDIIVDNDNYQYTLTRDGGFTVGLICVHDCGSCVYYVYKGIFDETSSLAREILALVDTEPDDVDDSYLTGRNIYAGLAA